VGLTEFVALVGELGTGKSHALRYFQNYILSNKAEFGSPCIYLPTLRVAEAVTFLDLYAAIVRELGRHELQRFSKALVAVVRTEVEHLKAAAPAEAYKKWHEQKENIEQKLLNEACEKVMGPFSRWYQLFERLNSEDDAAWHFISASGTKLGKEDIARLGVNGSISTDFEAVLVLGMIVYLGCGIRLEAQRSWWKGFYLFIDEIETMADMEPKGMLSLNQSFRDLLNACPEHLCLMLGLTGDAASVEVLFSTGLLSRLTREPLQIPALGEEQAEAFLLEVLTYYRIDAAKSDACHPFSSEALKYIVNATTDKTPRRLFMNCRRVAELSGTEGILKAKGKIDKEDAERFLL
jgi:hypothetical protein